MAYDIFKAIPHQRVISKHDGTEEIFDLYQCGIFSQGHQAENIELVELQPGADYRPHYHLTSCAVIYIISGTGQFILDNHPLDYQPGLRINIPAGKYHGFKTTSPTLFLSIQSPPIINPDTQEIDIHYDQRVPS